MAATLRRVVMGDRGTSLPSRTSRAALAAAALAVLLLAPVARSDSSAVKWTPPTPANNKKFNVAVGSIVTFTLTAATSLSNATGHIDARGLATDASFNSSDGSAAAAAVTWTPKKAGDHAVRFTATATEANGTKASAPARNYVIHVYSGAKPARASYPYRATLTTAKTAQWAAVLERTVVHAKPKKTGRVITVLSTRTTDATQNLVLVLDTLELSPSKIWYHVRLPILPNNSTGWVQADDLGELYKVNTHLYVDRKSMTARLERNGVTAFRSMVR